MIANFKHKNMLPIFRIVHIVAVMLLLGITFVAIANPLAEHRKKVLMYSGIASLIVVLTGFGLLGSQHMGVPPWAIVKALCWLTISALAGIAYRVKGKERLLFSLASGAMFFAVVMVSLKPF